MNTSHGISAGDFGKFQNLPQFLCQMEHLHTEDTDEQQSFLPGEMRSSLETVLDFSDQAGDVVVFFLNRFDLTLPENISYKETAQNLADFMGPFLIRMKEMLISNPDMSEDVITRFDTIFDKWDEIIEDVFFLTDEQARDCLEQLSEATGQAVPLLPDWKESSDFLGGAHEL